MSLRHCGSCDAECRRLFSVRECTSF